MADETGELTGVNPEQVESSDRQATLEVKHPNERLLLLAKLSERIVGKNMRLLEERRDADTDRLPHNALDKYDKQIRELEVLLELSARIKNGEPFVPFDLQGAEEDSEGITTLRLAKSGGKIKTIDRGGLPVLHLQLVNAPVGESDLDAAYSRGLRGQDPEKIFESTNPEFRPQAQQTIFVSSELVYLSQTRTVKSKPQAGFALSYNRGEVAMVNGVAVPIARVGDVHYNGSVPYIADINTKVFMPTFRQIEGVITSGSKTKV